MERDFEDVVTRSKDAPVPSSRIVIRRLRGLALIALSLVISLLILFVPDLEEYLTPPWNTIAWMIDFALLAAGVLQIVVTYLPKRKDHQNRTLRRHRVLIPREGLVYLVIMIVLFSGSLVGHNNMLMLVFAMLTGPFVINGWSAFAMLKSCRPVRTAPPRVMCGELFGVELLLKNTRSWMSLWMLQVRDTVTGCGETLYPTNLFTCVPLGGQQTGHYSLRLRHRGAYSFGPLYVTCRFPLGLIERGQTFTSSEQILVYPRVGRLTRHAQRQLLGSAEISSARRARMGIHHDEFHHLREYRPGDNPKAIHWRTTARRGTLILREFEQNREQQLSIIVDLWQPAHPVTNDDRERVEWALCLATSLCLAQRQQSREARLSLCVAGQSAVWWEGRATAASLESLLDQLATIQAGSADQLPELLQHVCQGSKATRYVLISTRTEDREVFRERLSLDLPPAAIQKLQWVFVDLKTITDWVQIED